MEKGVVQLGVQTALRLCGWQWAQGTLVGDWLLQDARDKLSGLF